MSCSTWLKSRQDGVGRITEAQAKALFRKCGATSEQWALDRKAFDKAAASDEQRRAKLQRSAGSLRQ